MSTVAQVQAQWDSSVWQDSSVTALTDKIYDYEIVDRAMTRFIKRLKNQKVNFFSYTITRSGKQPLLAGGRQYTYEVEVKYYREDIGDGSAQDAVKSGLETVDTLVHDTLGNTWGSTVTYSEALDNTGELELEDLAGRDVWVGTLSYIGTKLTN